MSLLVWLPMTKDLTQQGLSDLTVTNNGATLNDNGKLGKCYYFDGSDDYINLGSSIGSYFDGSPISFAFWVKSLENGTRGVIFGSYESSSTTNYFNIEVNSGSHSDNALRFCWKGLETYSSAGMVTYNAWVHIAVVWDGTKVSFYKNGTLLNSNAISPTSIPTGNTYYIGRDGRTGGTAFYGYLNDFRFYDHALSAKEIEILSRGLVAHYPLCDSAVESTTNLVTSITAGGQTTVSGDAVTTSGTNGDTYFYLNLSESITSGSVYSISCDVTGMNPGEAWEFPVGGQSNTALSWKLHNGHNEKTFTANNISWGTNRCMMDDLSGRVLRPITFSHWQIEKKDHPTVYAGLGGTRTAGTTSYDCSGYQYNGTNNGSLTVSTDTARYKYCTYFSADANYISLTSPASTVRTVSFWIKYPTAISGYRVAFGDYKSKLAFGMINSTTACITCNSNLKQKFTITTPTTNTWYHIVVKRVSDSIDADVELYINGVKQTTRGDNDNWNHTTDTLMIGRRSTGSTVNAYLSDFRAYSTILTETQIKELYNTAVSVANNGTLLGYELVEV